MVTWEAQSALDLVNVKLPGRIATKELFPGIGAFAEMTWKDIALEHAKK